MNKIVVLSFLILGLHSIQCERAVWSRTSEYTLENKTDRTFYVHIYPSPLFAYIQDTLRGYMKPFNVFEGKYYRNGLTKTGVLDIFSVDFFLYNLDDTTSINTILCGEEADRYNNKTITFPLAFDRYYNELDVFEKTKLYITDSLVQIMQKDYTMLEKFKNYYSTPH